MAWNSKADDWLKQFRGKALLINYIHTRQNKNKNVLYQAEFKTESFSFQQIYTRLPLNIFSLCWWYHVVLGTKYTIQIIFISFLNYDNSLPVMLVPWKGSIAIDKRLSWNIFLHSLTPVSEFHKHITLGLYKTSSKSLDTSWRFNHSIQIGARFNSISSFIKMPFRMS